MATALDLARRETFDVLVSDLGLPDGSGYYLMNRLVTSGLQQPGHRAQWLRYGRGCRT